MFSWHHKCTGHGFHEKVEHFVPTTIKIVQHCVGVNTRLRLNDAEASNFFSGPADCTSFDAYQSCKNKFGKTGRAFFLSVWSKYFLITAVILAHRW